MAIRSLSRDDLDLLAQWPSYPWPYDVFRFSFASLGKSEMDAVFMQRAVRDDRITLVTDVEEKTAIGYVTLVDIDWEQKKAGNMGIRIHPAWCDKGIGTRMLQRLVNWWFEHGMRKLTLDVAATNQRAVACYSKVGFRQIGEFWREAPDLNEVDLLDPCFAFLADHVRTVEGSRQIRFYWMEIASLAEESTLKRV